MACRGRCAGCGKGGPLKAVTAHILRCEKWAALYRADPDAALGPAAEHERWQREDRAAEKAAALQARMSQADARRAAMTARYASHDFLED